MTLGTKLRWKEHIDETWRAQYKIQENVLATWTQLWVVHFQISSYINKFYYHYGVMVSSFGDVPVILTSKWFNVSRTKC
jgi:hypothetical protein